MARRPTIADPARDSGVSLAVPGRAPDDPPSPTTFVASGKRPFVAAPGRPPLRASPA